MNILALLLQYICVDNYRYISVIKYIKERLSYREAAYFVLSVFIFNAAR